MDWFHHSYKLAILFLLIGLISCDLNTPSDPSWNNPFDVNNPDTRGDPYQIQASMEDEMIWFPPDFKHAVSCRLMSIVSSSVRNLAGDTFDT